jgi:hypothetical protein
MKEILNSYSSSELKKFISNTNIKGYSKMKKAQLISLMMKPEHISKFSNIKPKEKKTNKQGKKTPMKETKMMKPIPKPRTMKKMEKPIPKPRTTKKPKKNEFQMIVEDVKPIMDEEPKKKGGNKETTKLEIKKNDNRFPRRRV